MRSCRKLLAGLVLSCSTSCLSCQQQLFAEHKLLVMPTATGCCRSACCCLLQLVFSNYLADLQELRALLCSMGQRGSPPMRSLAWAWMPRPPGLGRHRQMVRICPLAVVAHPADQDWICYQLPLAQLRDKCLSMAQEVVDNKKLCNHHTMPAPVPCPDAQFIGEGSVKITSPYPSPEICCSLLYQQ